MTTSESPLPETRWNRLYRREMAILLASYAVLLAPTLMIVNRLSGAARYVVSMLPIVPFGFLGWIVVRSLQRVDERQRLLTYRAITFAFFATSVVTFGYGFLENAGAPHLSMFAVWPVMGVMWIAGGVVAPKMP